MLWNAPWWWHRINNHDGLSIGIAIRNNKVTKLNFQNNFTYTMSSHTYLFYNSLVISLYEKFFAKGKDFMGSTTKDTEKTKSNVLYQIEGLCKKYPNSIKNIQDILSNY